MATSTPNLGLSKPEAPDEILATLAALGVNFDTLDEELTRYESTANGDLWRFANGLQVCIGQVDLTYSNARYLQGTWTFPAAFIRSPTWGLISGLPTSGGQYLGGLNLNGLGAPFLVGAAGLTIWNGGAYNNDANYNSGYAITGVRIMALGAWK